jgi:integrase
MGRKRIKDLPPNLYEDDGYYRYRNPKTKTSHKLGKDREIAIRDALQLNAMLEPVSDRVKEILCETDKKNQSISKFLDHFESDILPSGKLTQSTLSDYKYKINHIKKAIGEKSFEQVNIFDIAEFLKQFPAKQSNNYRSVLSVIFKHAIAEGLTKENPADATIKKTIEVKRQRLSLEGFYAIRKHAPEWLQNTMDLALITAQRRGDLVALKWADIHDDFIWIKQQKVEKWGTGNIKIPVTPEIVAILIKCKNVSEFVISYQNKPVNGNYLSKSFQKARDESGYFKEMTNPPSFHEIRALNSFVQKKAGIETNKTQILLGHSNEKMTVHYQEKHEVSWQEVDKNILRKFCGFLNKDN